MALLQRQDRLLHCCLALLLNLAEDPSTERKMKNKVRGRREGWQCMASSLLHEALCR